MLHLGGSWRLPHLRTLEGELTTLRESLAEATGLSREWVRQTLRAAGVHEPRRHRGGDRCTRRERVGPHEPDHEDPDHHHLADEGALQRRLGFRHVRHSLALVSVARF